METPIEVANTAEKVVLKLNKTVLITAAAGVVVGVGGKYAFDKLRARRAVVKVHGASAAK